MPRPLLASLALALVLAACGETPPPCVPGETQECVGPGACRGGQMCNAEGSGFEPCVCAADAGPQPDAGLLDRDAGSDAGQDTSGDSGTGGDSGTPDGAVPDGGVSDAGTPDAGIPDAGPCSSGCDPVELAAGPLHTCARRGNGEVLCWGRNQESQLGDGLSRHEDCAPPGSDPEDCSGAPVFVRVADPPSLASITGASSLALGAFAQSCAIVSNEVWCWSREATSATAGGVARTRPLAERETHYPPNVHEVAVEGGRQCAIAGAQRALTCRGNNDQGQLGHGTFSTTEMSPVPVFVQGGSSVLDVIESEGGWGFHCARTTSEVYCWGRNDQSQLGDGSTTHDMCRDADNNPFDCSARAIAVGGFTTLGEVADLDVGWAHVCVVDAPVGTPGEVHCWGNNGSGQAGQAATTSAVGLPAAVPGVFATTIALGTHHSCALQGNGTVRCWGGNEHGQLGDGLASHGMICTSGGQSSDCSPTPVTVQGIDNATLIGAGGDHTCVVRSDATVWCWGANGHRQLGDGTRTDRFAPVQVAFPTM